MMSPYLRGAMLLIGALALGCATIPDAKEAKASNLAPGAITSAAELQWINLYNGKNLDGWVQKGDMAHQWKADGDCIVGLTGAAAKINGFLCTEKEYGDFIMEADFKVDPKLNSGIQVRSLSYPDYQNNRVHGTQVEIDPAARAWTGGIQGEGGRSWLYDLKQNEPARKAFKQNEWNHFTIVCVGETMKTWLNGVPAANLRDNLTPIGFIALQVHKVSSPTPLEVRYKNMRLLPLDQDIMVVKTEIEKQELSPTDKKSAIPPTILKSKTPSPVAQGAFKGTAPAAE